MSEEDCLFDRVFDLEVKLAALEKKLMFLESIIEDSDVRVYIPRSCVTTRDEQTTKRIKNEKKKKITD
jgi:hypothetical protein